MHGLQLLSVFVVGCLLMGHAAKLPSWVKPCYRDDPAFNACALKSGRAALPKFVEGYRKLHIPVLDPLLISELRLGKAATRVGLKVSMKDIRIVGLKDATLNSFEGDFENKGFRFSLFVPRMEFLHTYNISGRILVLPITGEGPGNVTLSDVSVGYDVQYDLAERANGKQYMTLRDDKVTFETKRSHVHLYNLFNGDKALGESMNAFFNDHWKEMMTEVGPVITETLGQMITQLLNSIADQVSYDDIVPSKPK